MNGLVVSVGACTVSVVAACSFSVSSSPAGPGPDAIVDASSITLVDTGLVARYFIDEAADGQGPTELIDSAPDPSNLPITYGQAVYVDDGNRGLRWSAALGTGKAEKGLSDPKLGMRLRAATQVTLEVVADVDGASGTTLCHIAGMRGANPDFILSAIGPTELRFHRPFNTQGASWAGINDRERMVLHVVFDSTQADGERRIELYKDGVLVPKTNSNPPDVGSNLMLNMATAFLIGNHQAENRSIAGTIYYVAYYDQPLTAAQVANNATRLLVSDDR